MQPSNISVPYNNFSMLRQGLIIYSILICGCLCFVDGCRGEVSELVALRELDLLRSDLSARFRALSFINALCFDIFVAV